jgi:4-diphosphocytidyl-2-C-methyl-D-erythritol kinase
MTSIELTAPAKVNLFLKVLNKRKDGYHNILTLFERITLADEIKISKIPKGITVSSDKFITRDPKDNLVYKAAKLILAYKKVKTGVRITIKKRIPIAAGLGGGSSDAASALMGINKLLNLKLKEAELVNLGKILGADVPFFILNTPFAVGKARGDELKKIDMKIRPWHLIIYPGFKVATRTVYEAFDAPDFALTRKVGDAKIIPSLRHTMDLDGIDSMLYNDLQDTVIAKKEAIGRIVRRLASLLDKKAIVSGSGPSVFCLYRTRKETLEGKKKLFACVPASERKSWLSFVAGTQGLKN